MAHRNIQDYCRDRLWRGLAAGHTLGSTSPLDQPDDLRRFRSLLSSTEWWPAGEVHVRSDSRPGGLHVIPYDPTRLALWSGAIEQRQPLGETVAISILWDGRVARTTKGPFLDPPELVPARDRVQPNPDQRQLVTFDSTVWHLGLRAERFRPTDYLVASHGVALDVEYVPEVLADDGGRQRPTRHPLGQRWWEEIPTSDYFRAEHREVRLGYRYGTVEQRALLSLGDLVCAATASLYGIPLYTTKPDAYKFLKLGIKTLKYGAVRHPEIVVGKRPRPLPVPQIIPRPIPESERTPVAPPDAPSLTPAQQVLAYWDAGNDYDETAVQLLAPLAADPSALARVGSALLDFGGGATYDWQRGFVEVVLLADPATASPDDRQHVVELLENASAGAHDRGSPQRREVGLLAIDALGEWGVLDSRFDDLLGDFDDDEESHIWYRALLRLHGVSSEATMAELFAVEQGTSTPSVARIRELAGRQPQG